MPSHLEYAYLKGDKSCPVIISSKLTGKEKTSLLQVLEKQKGAIAWKMSDIKGISPSFCTHKILMEESFKPVIRPQRRLNPKVQDMVKDEIIKLLDSGLIYPILDIGSFIYIVKVLARCISSANHGTANDMEQHRNLLLQTMEQQMTLLCDIDPMMDDVKVLARCISIWKSHAAGKPNQPWGLDVVLQDPEGNRIQASIKLENMNKFLAVLDEGLAAGNKLGLNLAQ
ncbi:hypothetical protein Tco_0950986 [Tanacetum coccineum]|uniref:Uncharacterized protein n=1 Tax=Tanacetum coccineum TaxID=301880 RepID=A0ABQ5DVH0_9ASTR